MPQPIRNVRYEPRGGSQILDKSLPTPRATLPGGFLHLCWHY